MINGRIFLRKALVLVIVGFFMEAGSILDISNDISIVAEKNNLNTTLYVGGTGPENYTMIQDAIDNASNGDTIYVYNGTYYENIVIERIVTIIGEDKDTTIIDGGRNGDVVSVLCDRVNITDFSVQHSKKEIGGEYYAGIYLRSNDSNIFENDISNNNKGIIIDTFGNNFISNNVLSNNDDGMYFVSTSSNSLMNNIVILNNHAGINFEELYASSNNIIKSNNISSNVGHGIRIGSLSIDNIFYHNNLNNTINAYDEGINTWYDVNHNSGNHWFDFDEESEGAWDNNSDSIVDSPYNISGGSNQDKFPLMKIKVSSTIYVNQTYHEGTSGWNTTHFNTIQKGIDAAKYNYTILVADGIYYENIIINKTINIINYPNESTVIDGGSNNSVINISANGVNIVGFTIRNSGIDEGNAGIKIFSNYNTIRDNSITGNNDGIFLKNSLGNVLSDNDISANERWGIYILNSMKNTVRNNTLFENIKTGIVIDGESLNNYIFVNNIKGNHYYGIWVGDSPNGNIIYHNHFNNSNNAFDQGANTWYNISLKEGNFWSDYLGEDVDYNGIGDTPYEIPGGSNKDLYPRVNISIDTIFVDDDYNESTLGWNVTHFDKIQNGVDAAENGCSVQVSNGTYFENLVINKSINIFSYFKNSTIDANKNGCVVNITADEVKILGFAIRNSGEQNAGIEINSDLNTVEGNNISNNYVGISLLHSKDNDIKDNDIISNDVDGICINYSNENIVSGNNINSNKRNGISMEGGSSNNVFSNNISFNNVDGMSVVGRSRGNTIRNNNFISNNAVGVHCYSTDHPVMNNIISYNRFLGNNVGIYLYFSVKHQILHNNIGKASQDGIILEGGQHNNISGNNISSNHINGIYVSNSIENEIRNNLINANGKRGVYFYSSDENEVKSGNNISKNEYGIRIENSEENEIKENDIVDNSRLGIYIDPSSHSNIIYHNNLKNKKGKNVWDGGNNVWNGSYCTGGNYWSYYEGIDKKHGPNQDISGSDGIGDKAHFFIAGQDKYPFMEEYGWWHRLMVEVKGGIDRSSLFNSGLIVGINIVVKNYGQEPAEAAWDISINGGLFNQINRHTEGADTINPKGKLTVKVKMPRILSIGRVDILVSVEEQNWRGKGFVFGPFVFFIREDIAWKL